MNGISRKKHQQLIELLSSLEVLMDKNTDAGALQETRLYRTQLTVMISDYEKKLRELALLIDSYEALHALVKTQFIGKKLRELRKEISSNDQDFSVLMKNIELARSA